MTVHDDTTDVGAPPDAVETLVPPRRQDELIPPAGTVIDETYEVTGVLGRGGVGVVLQARDQKLDRIVALKIVLPALLHNEDMCQSFQDEARAMARVHHPNVVAVHSFGDLERLDGPRTPYYVMEYVEGSSLRAVLDSNGGTALPVTKVLELIEAVAAGVDAIHDAGAAHLDVKPSNVLVGRDGRIAVSDLGFGTNRPAGNSFVGTPAYAAPELILGAVRGEAARAADVYSLGVMAFELLVGRKPYIARDIQQLLSMKLTETAPNPSELCADLPPSVDGPLLRSIEADPADRPKTAKALARALREATQRGAVQYRGHRVLLVDDDEEFLAFCAAALLVALPGAQLLTASSARKALQLFDSFGASLAVVDLNMPEMGGAELLTALRGLPGGAELPIVVATAYGGAKDWQELRQQGASAFLVKPFEPSDLIAVVRRIVDLVASQSVPPKGPPHG